jgi:hypothetical protein
VRANTVHHKYPWHHGFNYGRSVLVGQVSMVAHRKGIEFLPGATA